MREVTGWAAATPGAAPAPWTFARRDPRARDVVVRVTHCGVCATDRHALAHGDPASFPLVAGHEMTGVVEAAGDEVTDLARATGSPSGTSSARAGRARPAARVARTTARPSRR